MIRETCAVSRLTFFFLFWKDNFISKLDVEDIEAESAIERLTETQYIYIGNGDG